MRKIKISAVAFMVNVAAFAQHNLSKDSQVFQRYVSKKIYTQTSYVNEGVSGKMVVRVSFKNNRIDSISIVSGLSPLIDEQVLAFIKKTPQKISSKMCEVSSNPILVPLRFVIKEN